MIFRPTMTWTTLMTLPRGLKRSSERSKRVPWRGTTNNFGTSKWYQFGKNSRTFNQQGYILRLIDYYHNNVRTPTRRQRQTLFNMTADLLAPTRHVSWTAVERAGKLIDRHLRRRCRLCWTVCAWAT